MCECEVNVQHGRRWYEPLNEILDEYLDKSLKPDDNVEENEDYMNISEADYENISQQQETLSQYAGQSA